MSNEELKKLNESLDKETQRLIKIIEDAISETRKDYERLNKLNNIAMILFIIMAAITILLAFVNP